jgi:uncharacterized lipoprotein YajG
MPKWLSIMTQSIFFRSLAVAAILLLTGCATGPASNAVASQCPSKSVAAGNNGAKADRYYQTDCQ